MWRGPLDQGDRGPEAVELAGWRSDGRNGETLLDDSERFAVSPLKMAV